MRSTAVFGPGGNSDGFKAAGYKSTLEAPEFVKSLGLGAYEYEAGRGISLTEDKLLELGAAAKERGIELSLHAPYYISLSGVELQTRLKSIGYIKESVAAAELLGADTIVIHCGSAGKISRAEAMHLAADTLLKAAEAVEGSPVRLGIETMGKQNQLGTLEEVLKLCRLAPCFAPVVDFGHLNARECGGVFPNADAYRRVFDRVAGLLSDDAARYMHCHFSKIEFTAAGEKRHLTFEDTAFGPDFEPLMEAIAREHLCPRIISESAGTQSEDALAMQAAYLRFCGV